jgi:ribosome-associated protein
VRNRPDNSPAEYAEPSKSQRKRDHLAVQKLATELISAPAAWLVDFDLGERTRSELLSARRMSPGGSRNRQIRLLAQLLVDEDIDRLRSRLDTAAAPNRAAAALHHDAERWRNRILKEGAPAIQEFTASTGAGTAARLSELRALSLDPLGGRRARHAHRELFRLLLQAASNHSDTKNR